MLYYNHRKEHTNTDREVTEMIDLKVVSELVEETKGANFAVRESNGLRYEGVRRNGCTHVCIYEKDRGEPFLY